MVEAMREATRTLADRLALANKVREVTLELGPDPQAMAVRLAELGHTGTMGNSQDCVMAHYYRAQFPGEHVAVTCSLITVDGCSFSKAGWTFDGDDETYLLDGRVLLPAQVFEFIPLFDARTYPDLVDPDYPIDPDDDEDDEDDEDDFDDDDLDERDDIDLFDDIDFGDDDDDDDEDEDEED